MTDEAASRRVTERLAALREADGRLARALEATTAHVSSLPETAIEMEPAEAIAAAIAALREPLPAELLALAAAEEVSTRQGLDLVGDGPAPLSPRRRTLSRAHTARSARPRVPRRRCSLPAASCSRARRATSRSTG